LSIVISLTASLLIKIFSPSQDMSLFIAYTSGILIGGLNIPLQIYWDSKKV
jgi:hypothetical protein